MPKRIPGVLLVAAVLVAAVLVGVLAGPALAVTVTRAEVSGTRLRLEGTAVPSRDITADGVVLGRSDGSGAFRIERDPFTAPADCTLDVRDGSALTVVRLSGCTATAAPPPADTTAPTVPADLRVSVAGTSATLSWSASTDDTGVTGYRVSRNGAALPGTVSGLGVVDSGLAAGSYTYTVAATDGAGNVSGPSNSVTVTVPPPPVDTTAPTTPTGLVTTLVGTTIGLSWGGSTDDTGVTGYRITRNGAALATTNDTTYSDVGLAAGTYTYTVAAFDGAGNTSGQSTSASATVAAPAALSFLTAARLPDATVGQQYLGYIVANDPPGPSSFRFKLVSGKVPSGTRFVENTLPARPEARVVGTPTAAGSSSFTVEVTDGTGASARRTFLLTVLAG